MFDFKNPAINQKKHTVDHDNSRLPSVRGEQSSQHAREPSLKSNLQNKANFMVEDANLSQLDSDIGAKQ